MALANITRHIILDVSISKYISILVKETNINVDTIIATVTDNGKPYPIDGSIIPRMKCSKSNNTYIYNDCTILDNGTIQIDVTEQMTSTSGLHRCELVLFDSSSDSVLHTMDFIIVVKETVFSDDEISSTNEFISLERAILSVDEMEISVDEMKKIVADTVELSNQLEIKVDETNTTISEINRTIENELVHIDQLGVAGGIPTLNENGLINSNLLEESYIEISENDIRTMFV